MANILRDVLNDQGRTQTWLTKVLKEKGIERDLTTINRWCKGRHSPRDEFVRQAMAELLSVPHDELFPDSVEKVPFDEEAQPKVEEQTKAMPEEIVQVKEVVQPQAPKQDGGPSFNDEVAPAEQKQEQENNIPDAPKGDGDFKAV